jgi:two-component system, OmpR family, sensor histidine kinase ChvG
VAPRFRHSLRFKLLLVALTLLLIPWAGYQYLKQMENTLKQAQEGLLLNRAEIVSDMLSNLDFDWVRLNPPDITTSRPSLYVHPLNTPPDIDGYPEEWQALNAQVRRFNARSNPSEAVGFDWLAGRHGDMLYLLIEVRDPHIVYPRSDRSLSQGDHLILAVPGNDGQTRQFILGTPAPGWIAVHSNSHQPVPVGLRGEWQESDRGYRVELQIPLTLTQGRLSLAVIDVDAADQAPQGIASTSGWRKNANLAYLALPNQQADSYLSGLEHRNYRYTLLNRQRQVIGRQGHVLTRDERSDNLWRGLLELLFAEPVRRPFTERERRGELDGPEIRQALDGQGSIYRYPSPDSSLVLLSSAFPVRAEGRVQGVVVVEQSTREILLLQQGASEDLIGLSLGLFLITGGSLLWLASLLARRITRLSDKYQQLVSPDGRILGEPRVSPHRDELGHLDESLGAVLKRTQAYTRYLESMASRIAHEFRTPLSMIQSSLENLQLSQNDRNAAEDLYVSRALEGTQRLNLILRRLREATRLEQAFQDAEQIETDLGALVVSLCQGYQDSQPQARFMAQVPETGIIVRIAPDLICQAVDKLVSNAVDFHRPGTPIVIEVGHKSSGWARLSVENQGPSLDLEESGQIFMNMKSQRGPGQQGLHLGLGLYLVRLIAEFHQGRAWAENTPRGVSFGLDLPSRSESPDGQATP